MKILLYIIISFLAPWILFVIGVFLHAIYELATSKVSKEEQERRIATYERTITLGTSIPHRNTKRLCSDRYQKI